MSERIEVGDTVDVFWETVPTERGCKVLYTPHATGDTWILQRQPEDPSGKDDQIFHVGHFAKMVKRSR